MVYHFCYAIFLLARLINYNFHRKIQLQFAKKNIFIASCTLESETIFGLGNSNSKFASVLIIFLARFTFRFKFVSIKF
ncbi:hypothetical protein EGI22_11100 [Lacihabitans sp. LS3-19]|nr:hypothetical protein [Lacihabitans sp. LS3-19]